MHLSTAESEREIAIFKPLHSPLMADIATAAQARPRRIVLPEADDPRVVEAATQLAKEGLAQPILINPKTAPTEGIQALYSADAKLSKRCIEALCELRAHKGLTREAANNQVRENALLFAALLLHLGEADVAVAGSVASTAEVLRAALLGVGPAPGVHLVSSFFLMQLPDRVVTYADCAVVPDPDPGQLAEIAIVAAANHQRLTQETPRVALLSFSTKGSANHKLVEKQRAALAIIQARKPDLDVDGELQFDAALLPDIAAKKAPNSVVAGRANVMIFPDLNAGNIAYKITERLAGARAIGPIIQGLAKPCMDLSRGCSVQDIVDVSCVASAMLPDD